MPLDVALGHKLFLTLALDRHVNMGCTTRIRHGLDGSEEILTIASGQETAKALEVTVWLLPSLWVNATCMAVVTVGITLPNLNQCPANRLTAGIQNTPR